MSQLTTWNKQLGIARREAGDESTPVTVSPSSDAFEVEFDSGYGGSEGPAVLAWTDTRVYFPVVYDGSEWIESAPRDPVPYGQEHVGGQ